MNVTVNVICFRGKKLSNGESPLMLRISKDRKTKYKNLGISINPIWKKYILSNKNLKKCYLILKQEFLLHSFA